MTATGRAGESAPVTGRAGESASDSGRAGSQTAAGGRQGRSTTALSVADRPCARGPQCVAPAARRRLRREGGLLSAGRADRQRGSATVLLLAVVLVALTLAVGATALGRAAQARGVAQTAADLAAIAAAQEAQETTGGCAVAGVVARENGASLTSCTMLAGGDVQVETAVSVEPLAGWRTTARAVARAGPVR